MSQDQNSSQVVVKRKKIIMDSDEEERQEQERTRRIEEKERRRTEKELKEKQEEEKRRQEKEQEREKRRKDRENMDFSILLEPDSNSNTSFTKIRAAIKQRYPKLEDRYGGKQPEKKVKKEVKPSRQKEKTREKSPKREKEIEQSRPQRTNHVKRNTKEQLVYQVLRRWWYVTDKWIPENYDYTPLLQQNGYRLVPAESFRKQADVVDRLLKAAEVECFPGVFRTKEKLVDLRPKDNIPSFQNYMRKQVPELMDLLKLAMRRQIAQLEEAIQKAPYKSKSELEHLQSLQRQLLQIQ